MSTVQGKRQEKLEIRFLVIDDEIGANQKSQDEFINDLGFVNTKPQFAVTCEEAIQILKQDLEIKFCFLDCKLPKTIKQSINYNPNSSDEYGIQLADEILKIDKKMPIIVFSGYVDETILEERASNRSNIVGQLRKNDTPEFYQKALKLALEQCGISTEEFETYGLIQIVENVTFDYNQLSFERSQEVKLKTSTIKRLVRVTAESIIEIGKNLIEVKETLPKGQFYLWAGLEFPWNIRMLNRFMNVYRKFNDVPIEDVELLPITVLYELSPKSVEDEAILETIDLAKSGKSISVAKVKEIKQKYSESKKLTSSARKASLIKSNELQVQEKTTASDLKALGKKNDLSTSQPKNQILQILQKQRLWNVNNHIIYNGEPNSNAFLKLLPRKSAVCLNFSSDPNFNFSYHNYHSWLSLHYQRSNLEPSKLFDLLDHTIGNNSIESDSIIVLHIPHNDILNIINDWYCKAYIVDPDLQKCLKIAERGIDDLGETKN